MNHKTTTLIIAFFILFVHLKCLSQNPLDSYLGIKNNLEIEKAYLHTDRNLYSKGNTIWYKAYLLNDYYCTPTAISNNLYVELINPEKHVIDRNTNFVIDGTGQGHFALPDSIANGIYTVRAYTNYMRNFDNLLFFTKTIIVTDINDQTKNKKQEVKEGKIDLQFMPEGGNMVYNVNSKIAFKALHPNGKSFEFEGELYDQNNKMITRISSMHKGMGYFNLKPATENSYYVKITKPAINDLFFLPDAVQNGIALSVNNAGNEFTEIYVQTNTENVNGQNIKAIIHSHGKIISLIPLSINQAFKKLKIPKSQLPSGISCITIVDERNIPVAERLLFNQKSEKLIIDIETNKKQFFPREKILLDITTKDIDGNPVPANLSLSVADQIGFSDNLAKTPDIYSYFFLSSNFRGNIEEPSYYFTGQNQNKLLHLDLVLMTHGWRNFIWKEINEKANPEFNAEQGYTIAGKANLPGSNKPVADSKISIMAIDNDFLYSETTTDQDGNFRFEHLMLVDTTKLIFQAYDQKGKLDADFNINPIKDSYPDIKLKENDVTQLKYEFNNQQFLAVSTKQNEQIKNSTFKNHVDIEEVLVKAKAKKEEAIYRPNDGHHRISLIKPNNVINVAEILKTSDQSIGSILKSYVAGVRVVPGPNGPTIMLRSIGFNDVPPLFLIDGCPTDQSAFFNYPKQQIEKLEVSKGLSQANIYGRQALGGVIQIFSKKKFNTAEPEQNTSTTVEFNGYQRIRQFYSPNYENKEERLANKDLRITLYWNPEIKTDSLGKAKVSFFAADRNSTYKNIIQGISSDGKLGFSETEIKITDN